MISYEVPVPENIENLREEPLNYIDINSVNALRTAQDEFVNSNKLEAGVGLSDPVEIRREIANACIEAKSQLDDMTRDYLLQYIAEDDPKFAEYLAKLREFSIDNMTTDEMGRGPRRADGTFDGDLAGWRKLLDYRTAEIGRRGDIDADVDRINELNAETAVFQSALGGARINVAKKQVGYRHKGLMNRKKHREELKEAKEAYNTAVKNYATKFFELAKTQNPHLSEAELRTISAQITASEFADMTTEQAKSEYITGKYGKTVRKVASIGIVKKVALGLAITATLPVALLLGGGLLSFGAIGLATAYRGSRAFLNGPVSHSTDRGSNRVLNKLAREELEAARRVIGETSGIEADDYVNAVSSSTQSLHERIHKSDKTRRKVSAAVTAAAMIPLVGGVTRKAMGIGRIADESSGGRVTIDRDRPSVGRGNSTTGPELPPFSDGGQVVEARQVPDTVEVPQRMPVIVDEARVIDLSTITPEGWQGLYRMDMMKETGATPWARASNYFNGDPVATRNWLNEATLKAGGSWHNLGDSIDTNDWIDLNGASDTDRVWELLVTANPTPRPSA